MRDPETIVSQVREALRALDELKTAQFVGNSQIRVYEFISDTINVTSTSTGYFSEAFAHAIVMAPDVLPGNVLITYCVPEVYSSDGLISNKTDGRQVSVTTIESGVDDINVYQANIYHSSIGGETIPSETYSVKFHIYSAAMVSVTANGGPYGS